MIAPLDFSSANLREEVRTLFSPEGLLAKARNFEYRPQQQEMAVAVANALAKRHHVITEAGTGVGKSLAYLMPAVLHAAAQSRKIVVSTHTINLQEQLFHKDIPLVRKLLPVECDAMLLKGRMNYLCPKRLERAMGHSGDLFVKAEIEQLQRIWQWANQTEDGTLSDFDDPPDMKVWMQVCSEAHVCTPRTCGMDPRCFYQQARKKAEAARLVVINHSLFFNWLAGAEEDRLGDDEGYLFANDFVIFDEAHTLENVAARHLGIDISSSSMRRMLHRLYHPRTRKGLFVMLRRGEAVEQVKNVLGRLDAFFDSLETAIAFGKSREARVTRPDLVDNTLHVPLAQLHRCLKDIANETEDEYRRSELNDTARRIEGLRCDIVDWLSLLRDDHVYWAERSMRGHMPELQLLAAPVEVGPYLRRLLFRPDQTVVLTSATLSVGQGLEYFQKRIGGEDADALKLDSPFDYARQMKVYIPRHMPEPRDREAWQGALRHWIGHYVGQTNGRAFVLFTSYAAMKAVAADLEAHFDALGIEMLVQGGAVPRHRMLQKFKDSDAAVLFGTDSFWQGVDVPGESLENVIITRLPFAVPDHPLTQAKLELIASRGGDAFREYSLPEAILKFRQGVGRLIRTQQDKGIVVILDNRILSKSYGRAFKAVLPDCPVEIIEDEPDEGRSRRR